MTTRVVESGRLKQRLFRMSLLSLLGLILAGGLLLIATAIALFGWAHEGNREMMAEIGAAEGLPLAKLESDWSEACIATNYRMAQDLPNLSPDLAIEICDNFLNDNA